MKSLSTTSSTTSFSRTITCTDRNNFRHLTNYFINVSIGTVYFASWQKLLATIKVIAPIKINYVSSTCYADNHHHHHGNV